jgi:hypothetical protein
MPVPLSEGECTKERRPLSVVTDAVRVQWDEMEVEERAFLVYCLQRLNHYLHERQAWQAGEGARGHDATEGKQLSPLKVNSRSAGRRA